MKIKDVENILGVPKASIRFYEKEGLLTPERGENKYREYSEPDVERLRKIIVLRKIGMSVEDIKMLLDNSVSLQDALSSNITKLEKELSQIEGAIKVCGLMQKKEMDVATLDGQYYLDMIHEEEVKGNKFFEIINDIVEFEKKVIFDEFGIADEDGKMKYPPLLSAIIALLSCIGAGLIWFFMDGMNPASFVEGFTFPFVCIVISSVFGLPVHFIGKKSEKVANIIKKTGEIIGVVFFIVVVIMMIFTDI